MSDSLSGLVIAFDCDGTLDISEADPGPINADVLCVLLLEDAIVGMCGNTDPIMKQGYGVCTEFMTMHQNKTTSLQMTAEKFPYKTLYIFVGNTEGDRQAAREAGWTFIHADDFRMKIDE